MWEGLKASRFGDEDFNTECTEGGTEGTEKLDEGRREPGAKEGVGQKWGGADIVTKYITKVKVSQAINKWF